MMKCKSLCLMILVVLLCVCATTSISANAIWDGGETYYVIEGWLFAQLNENYPVEFNTVDGYKAYIMGHGQQLWVIERVDVDLYLVASENFEYEASIDEYDVYITPSLYIHWEADEGNIPTVNIVSGNGGAKDIFDSAATTTATIGGAVIDALYYNGNLTLLGWICCCGLGTTLTATLIKIISNTIRR